MTSNFNYNPSRSLPARLSRRLTQWNIAAPLGRDLKRPIVSFTFDDFPKSAAYEGAKILEDAGGRGTFYACTSFMGQTTATGEQFDARDVHALTKAGHEIGSHTHTHLDCSKTNASAVRFDIETNLKHLRDMGIRNVQSFAYPYGETQPTLKRMLRKKFGTARGVLAGQNTRQSDRMQLRAFEIANARWTVDRAAKAIRSAASSPAWIVIFTHDVCSNPSDYGTTPPALRELVDIAQDIGADIASVNAAVRTMDTAKND